MLTIERQLWCQFIRRTAVFVTLATVLVFLVHVRSSYAGSTWAVDTLLDQLPALELGLALAAPLALASVVFDWKRSGLLLGVCSAGLTPVRLRRTALLMACALGVASAGLAELSWWATTSSGGKTTAWHSGDLVAWSPGVASATRLEDLILFESKSLRTSRAQVATFSQPDQVYELSRVECVTGEPLAVRCVQKQPRRDRFLSVPPPSGWLEVLDRPNLLLGSLNRAALGAVLMLLLAGLALVVPLDRQLHAAAATLFLIPSIGAGYLYVSILLWQGGWSGYLAELTGVSILAGTLLVIDRLLRRRGLRLSG